MGCGFALLKVFMNLLNAFWMMGCICSIIAGVVGMNYLPGAILALLFMGATIGLVASILGCTGICREHVCATQVYAGLLLITLFIQCISDIMSPTEEVLRETAENVVSQAWENELKYRGSMDDMQESHHCCGKHGPTDYKLLKREVPTSCYPDHHTYGDKVHRSGCLKRLERLMIDSYIKTIEERMINIAFTGLTFVGAIYMAYEFKVKQSKRGY